MSGSCQVAPKALHMLVFHLKFILLVDCVSVYIFVNLPIVLFSNTGLRFLLLFLNCRPYWLPVLNCFCRGLGVWFLAPCHVAHITRNSSTTGPDNPVPMITNLFTYIHAYT